MKKRHLILILSAVALASLSGCTKDKPTEPAPLETIAPDIDTSEGDDLNDKLDDTSAPDLDISSYVVGPNGEKLTGDEAIAYEEEMLYGKSSESSTSESGETLEGDSLTESTSQSEDRSGVLDEGTGDSLTESTSQSQDGLQDGSSENTSQSESVPVDVASDQRDLTDDEYQQLQNEIDDWTYQEALKRMGIQQ